MHEHDKYNISDVFGAVDISEENIQAWWLDESSTSDKWKLKNMVPGSSAAYYTVSWKPQTKLITPLSILKWESWKVYSKRLAYHLIESEKTTVEKTSSLTLYCREIRALAEWLCFYCRLDSVEDIVPQHIYEYEEELKNAGLTVGSVEVKLSIFTYMFTFREDIGEGLRFSPYINGVKGVAKNIGKPAGHTRTIPPKDFLGLIDFSIKNVVESERTLMLLEQYLAFESEPSGGNKYVNFKKKFGIGIQEFRRQVGVVYASAIVIILSLTAMRKHEASAITYEDALASVNSGEYLAGKVHKTAGTETGRLTSRPVPQEVIDSVAVIIALTKESRRISNNKSTLLLNLPFSYSVKDGDQPSEYIDTSKLYRIFDHLTHSAGFEWKLRPHMLRRAFSMMWAWRFEVGDLEYLSNFLYHNDYRYTHSYVDDEDMLEFLDEETRKYTYEYFENLFLGHVSVAGGISSTISKYKRVFLARFNVITSERVSDFVETVIDRHSYRIIPNADGYCFISPGRESRAKCSTNGRKANYSNRSEISCAQCPNFGVDKSRKEYWIQRSEAHKKVMIYNESGMLHDAAKEGVKRAENIVRLIDKAGDL